MNIDSNHSISGFNWTRDDLVNDMKAPLTYHNIIEAFKFAYAPATFLGDPKFTNFTKDVRIFNFAISLHEKFTEFLQAKFIPTVPVSTVN